MNNFREIVTTALRNHPPDCMFAPNALELILLELEPLKDANFYQVDIVGAIAVAILKYEIYCPHEGIDRREEFGVSHEPRRVG